MKTKKNSKVNLENYRKLFFQFGLMVSLGIILLAFEWPSKDIAITPIDYYATNNNFDDEIAEITREPKQLEKPKPKPIVVPTVLTIIDDNTKDINNEYFPVEDYTENPEPYKIEKPIEEIDDEPVYNSETQPEFPGGMKELLNYLKKNLKYPDSAREVNLQGKVYVRFMVSKTGEIDRISLLRSVAEPLDNEAIRVVKCMPRWQPGENRGKPVNVWFTLPVNFVLNN